MNNKNCELCVKNKAKVYCESDQASLCWDCDSKVHSANFLVAKHTRNLLCHSCQNTTPWSASGPKLSPTLSACNSCLENPATGFRGRVEENYQMDTHVDEYDNDNVDEYEDETEIDEYEYDDDDDDDGNQVVPLSSSPSSTFSSGSYGDLSSAGDDGGATAAVSSSSSPWKRLRESDCLHSEDEEECSSSLNCHNLLEENKGTSSSIGFLRPTKVLRTNELCQ